jgi:hypothetical protein
MAVRMFNLRLVPLADVETDRNDSPVAVGPLHSSKRRLHFKTRLRLLGMDKNIDINVSDVTRQMLETRSGSAGDNYHQLDYKS